MSVLVLCLLCTLVWGIAPIFEKMSLENTSSFIALTIRSVATTIVLLAISFATERQREIASIDSRTFLYVLVGGFFGILGLLLYFMALKKGEASRVVPLVNIFPLFTAFYSVVLLGEKLTAPRIVGIVLIVAGIILLNSKPFTSHAE